MSLYIIVLTQDASIGACSIVQPFISVLVVLVLELTFSYSNTFKINSYFLSVWSWSKLYVCEEIAIWKKFAPPQSAIISVLLSNLNLRYSQKCFFPRQSFELYLFTLDGGHIVTLTLTFELEFTVQLGFRVKLLISIALTKIFIFWQCFSNLFIWQSFPYLFINLEIIKTILNLTLIY